MKKIILRSDTVTEALDKLKKERYRWMQLNSNIYGIDDMVQMSDEALIAMALTDERMHYKDLCEGMLRALEV